LENQKECHELSFEHVTVSTKGMEGILDEMHSSHLVGELFKNIVLEEYSELLHKMYLLK